MKWMKWLLIALLLVSFAPTTIEAAQDDGASFALGASRTQLEQWLGKPKRVTMNEYKLSWYTYHDNYENFMMAMYDNNKLVGFYMNDNFSYGAIQYGMTRNNVRRALGKPATAILKGNTNYVMKSDEWDLFAKGNEYMTVFYDKYNSYKVTALFVTTKAVEQRKRGYYGPASDALKSAFELQNFDLTNSIRKRFGQPLVTWDKKAQRSATGHSSDMARNNYFDHTSLSGKEPWDRMKAAGINYMQCGENIAYGQFSSIYVHEGWMNSSGHRKNMLNPGWRYLGVGVAFDTEGMPYYTQNFWSK